MRLSPLWSRLGSCALLSTAMVLGCTDAATSPTSLPPPSLSQSTGESGLANGYIIQFRSDVDAPGQVADALVREFGGTRRHVYSNTIKGFAVADLPQQALDALLRHPFVESIEEDVLQRNSAVQALPLDGINRQQSSMWALDRLDERQATFDGQFSYDRDGSGVHVYIIDSGIRCSHEEFAGRIGNGVTTFGYFPHLTDPCIDNGGHGTQVAAAAAGTTFGTAKGAYLHPVRVTDGGSAYTSDIIAGLDWIGDHHIEPAVANLSYGSIPGSFTLRNTLEVLASRGVAVVKSAGNDNVDAFEDRANRANGAIIVGGTTRYDYRYTDSNFGSTITIWAPGASVRTAGHASDTADAVVWGTSFAAPLTTGAAALYLEHLPTASAYEVRDFIRDSATAGVLMNLGAGSPNLLLHAQAPPPPPPPIPLPVTISGPTEIQPGATCVWSAVTSGGTAPFSYSWKINGVSVGSGSSYVGSRPVGSAGSSFTLSVTVTDAANGYGQSSITVQEDAQAMLCPF